MSDCRLCQTVTTSIRKSDSLGNVNLFTFCNICFQDTVVSSPGSRRVILRSLVSMTGARPYSDKALKTAAPRKLAVIPI